MKQHEMQVFLIGPSHTVQWRRWHQRLWSPLPDVQCRKQLLAEETLFALLLLFTSLPSIVHMVPQDECEIGPKKPSTIAPSGFSLCLFFPLVKVYFFLPAVTASQHPSPSPQPPALSPPPTHLLLNIHVRWEERVCHGGSFRSWAATCDTWFVGERDPCSLKITRCRKKKKKKHFTSTLPELFHIWERLSFYNRLLYVQGARSFCWLRKTDSEWNDPEHKTHNFYFTLFWTWPLPLWIVNWICSSFICVFIYLHTHTHTRLYCMCVYIDWLYIDC